jgi:hypothetical protein
LGIEPAPILLGNASYYGTLAAVRWLGRTGVKVVTADPSMVCGGRFSRIANQHLACLAFEKFNALGEWLLPVGRTGPRRAIYATSDAVSFALARYRDELSTEFELCRPGLDTANEPRRRATAASQEAKRWRDWSRGSNGKIIAAVEDPPKDPPPSFVDVTEHLMHAMRHLHTFIKQYGLMQ